MFQVFNSFRTDYRVCGAHPSEAPEFYRFHTSLSEVRVVHADTCLHVFMLLIPCCDVRYDFRVKSMFDSCGLTPICFVGGSHFNYDNCIYLRILMSNTISI